MFWKPDPGLDGLYVYADPLLVKVFSNLFDNASRYSGTTTPRVTVGAVPSAGGLVLVLEDTGHGVAPGEKAQIFERGYGKNTGFGLFLAREIQGITDITITETGTLGKGARFELHIPEKGFRYS